MKFSLFLVFLLGTALCSSELDANLKGVVCETWKGLGEVLSGSECSSSIDKSCAAIFDVIPELIAFFRTFDPQKLKQLIDDVFTAISEAKKQIHLCNYYQHIINLYEYWVYMVKFIPHLIRFVIKLPSNIQSIIFDVKCIIKTIGSEDFYQTGICIGHLLKIMMDD